MFNVQLFTRSRNRGDLPISLHAEWLDDDKTIAVVKRTYSRHDTPEVIVQYWLYFFHRTYPRQSGNRQKQNRRNVEMHHVEYTPLLGENSAYFLSRGAKRLGAFFFKKKYVPMMKKIKNAWNAWLYQFFVTHTHGI